MASNLFTEAAGSWGWGGGFCGCGFYGSDLELTKSQWESCSGQNDVSTQAGTIGNQLVGYTKIFTNSDKYLGLGAAFAAVGDLEAHSHAYCIHHSCA